MGSRKHHCKSWGTKIWSTLRRWIHSCTSCNEAAITSATTNDHNDCSYYHSCCCCYYSYHSCSKLWLQSPEMINNVIKNSTCNLWFTCLTIGSWTEGLTACWIYLLYFLFWIPKQWQRLTNIVDEPDQQQCSELSHNVCIKTSKQGHGACSRNSYLSVVLSAELLEPLISGRKLPQRSSNAVFHNLQAKQCTHTHTHGQAAFQALTFCLHGDEWMPAQAPTNLFFSLPSLHWFLSPGPLLFMALQLMFRAACFYQTSSHRCQRAVGRASTLRGCNNNNNTTTTCSEVWL